MLKTYQFKTQCKGDIHRSKTANIILPGLMTEYRWTPLRVQRRIEVQCMIHGCWLKQLVSPRLNTTSLVHVKEFTCILLYSPSFMGMSAVMRIHFNV